MATASKSCWFAGDIASNESLTVTSNNTTGVVVQSGDVFVVKRTCSSST